MSKREVSYIISVSDRASAGFRKVAEGSRKARREVEGLESAAEDAGDAIEDAFDGDTVEGLSEELDKARRKTRQLGDEAKESGRGFGGMAKEAKKFVKVLAAAEATKFFVKQGKEAVNAAAQIESYQATLETMLGSTQAARDRMEEYKDIAKITPFGLEDVVEGGNQLQAIGRYSRENLEMLGDLAAATNKPMEQVMNAYAKLATGQKGEAARMFQDLLISRNDWIAATGKGASKNGELLASTEEMMAALPKIMRDKGFYGMMAKQAEKANGMFSNLGDSVFSLRAALGERMMPTVKSATTGLTKMAESMERAVRIPLEQKIRDEKIELNQLVGALERSWDKEDERASIINELNNKYPDFLTNINLEEEGLEGVRKKLVDVNAEYDRKIRKAYYARRLDEINEEIGDKYKDLEDTKVARRAKDRNAEIEEIASKWIHPDYKSPLGSSAVRYLHGASYDEEKGVYYYTGPGWKKTYFASWMNDLIREYQNNEKQYLKLFYTVGTSDEKLRKRESEYEQKIAERDNLERLMGISDGGGTNSDEKKNGSGGGSNGQDGQNGPAVQGGATPGGATVAGTTYGGGGGSGSGGGSGKTVTTNIGTLVGTIEIHTTTLQEGAAEVKRLVTQALLEAVPSDL